MTDYSSEPFLISQFQWMQDTKPAVLFETFEVPFTDIQGAIRRTLLQADKLQLLYRQIPAEVRTELLKAAYHIQRGTVQYTSQIVVEIDPHQSMIAPVLTHCSELAAVRRGATRQEVLPIFVNIALRVHAIHVAMHAVFGNAYVDEVDPLNRSHMEGHQLTAEVGSVIFRPFLDQCAPDLAVATAEFRRSERERYDRMRREWEAEQKQRPSSFEV